MVFSVRLSVRLSVCPSVTPFWLCSHHRIIMKFSGVITTDQGKAHAKGQGQRSKVKVTEVMTQLNRFRTVTPVWIHIWWWNDAYSLMLLRRGALLFLAATKQLYEWFSPSVRLSVRHRRITINILEILELPIFAYHTYYTSKHMYNWMKWLRLLGGWHFIAATAIKPPKAACQFAADDILLYEICYNIQWIYFTIWEKGKEELSPLQYHFKSLHIISRHYKKSLLRSQIYHGYEELSTDTNYPIWRRQKLPYMKKTRKKKQVCGAACFMAAEIKFSEDVRLSVRLSHLFDYVPIILSSWNFQELLPVTKVTSMQKVKVRGQRSRSQRSQPNLTVSGL